MSQPSPSVAAEQWFVSRGLPYFVDDIRRTVKGRLGRRPLGAVAAVAALFAAGAGIGTGLGTEDTSSIVLFALLASGVPLVTYAARRLYAGTVVRWTIGRTLSSLGLLVPLVTRALPLLLLFVTFLFINTEVWQVASALDDGVLWVSVVLFALVAIAFLLVRLPEELDQVDDEMTGSRLTAACAGTPLEDEAARVAASYEDADLIATAQVTGLAKANLVLVLLISQALQVLLLSLAMFTFFVVFGMVSIKPDVIRSWVGPDAPTPFVDSLPLLTHELVRVSTFLSAFSGLYFTVYAVSDETYRTQFFGSLMKQLRRAVGVRTVYRCLARENAGQ
ncbi:hypothetical protein ABIE44_003133 [Marmoricola sp. OAE513]|uniref:hypothetical protein n=1 Tax=Marmoricola sp. OAE513 TaxID=2817894 RepID=UPI001AE205FE